MNDIPDQTKQLRLAVQNLACAPQAQRRYVQLGLMRRAVENLDRIGAELPRLAEAGELDSNQAELIADLRETVKRNLEASPDFLEESDAAPRSFLFSTALENDGWYQVRHLARRCHSLLAGEDSPFAAIMAK